MSFPSQPLPNGLPAATQLDSYNKFQPPSITGQYQPQPPMTQQMQNKLPPHQQLPPQNQAQQFNSQHVQQFPQNRQQSLLVNGGSNSSSRTASPALNQSINSAHLPPSQTSKPFVGSSQISSQNQNLFPPRQPGSLHGSTQNLSDQNAVNPNVANLATNMQNMNITNGQHSGNVAANPYAPNLVNGNVNPLNAPRMPPKMNSNFPVNGSSTQQPLGSTVQNPPNSQYQPNINGQMPQQQQQFQRQQYPSMPPLNNHLPTNQATPPNSNIQTPPQQPFSQSQPNQMLPPGPASIQPQYPNQFPNNNQPNVAPPLYPPTTNSVAGPPLNNTNKRPMYPPQTSAVPTSMQQQQQQQQQQRQPPPLIQNPYPSQQSNVFTGQTNNAPIQYQNAKQSNYPQNPMGVTQQGFNRMWGHETVDLMQQRHILPTTKVIPPGIELGHEFYESVNCSSDILRCTLTKIPESNSLLQKSRLPLGILIHPFRDLNNLPVIQCSTIVRCRACRTYINPFVSFVDSKKWRCNLCYRVNELPDEFQYDPVSKSYGDVTRRPEVKSSTIEFIAPSEYMLRPPQPAIYLFLLDVSQIAQQSGYLDVVCQQLADHLDDLPGDARAQVGFIAYNSAVHFYSIAEGFNQPHEITVVDIEDPFLPCPDNLLINLNECKELIKDLLCQLPKRFANSYDSNSALGAALQIAYKLMHQPGGRVTVFQTCLPNVGPGALKSRENPNDRSAKEIQHLGPATDFYKRLALECSGQQIAVDVFLLNSQYSDLATISGISKFSGGCLHHFPLFNSSKTQQVEQFRKCLERYLTRKIGFESVMRVRCTRGLAIHTFHGNFFVRSTDLLSLPNVNPDAGFGMQISYEESLTDTKTVCFQAALLYTSSKGERRIRVHTLCLPVTASLSDVMHSADCQAIIGLISKMAVDRSLQTSITDARDAFINASVDVFSAFRVAQNLPGGTQGQLIAPTNLSLLPLYMLALLKHVAFRTGTSTRLDDRVFAMCELKTMPLDQLIRNIYPDFYHLDNLFYQATDDNEDSKYDPPLLQLSAERLDSRSVFMLDTGLQILILVGTNVPPSILKNVFGISSVNEIPDQCYDLPTTGTPENEALHTFIETISVDKPYTATIQIIRDSSPLRTTFTEKLVDDRSESSLSYYEFLQHLRSQVK